MIWYRRNLLAHSKNCIPLESAALSTRVKVNAITEPGFKFRVIDEDAGFNWEISESFDVKINVDASWILQIKKAGYGYVAKHKDGSIIRVHAGLLDGAATSFDAEGKALLRALLWAESEN